MGFSIDYLPISRHEASCILWTFDHFYKLGIRDAQDERDEMFCLEFINKTTVPGMFGLVGDENLLSGSEWILAICYQLRGTRVVTTMRKLMDRITRDNYYWCLLPLIQDFYNKGMKDFYAKPKYDNIEIFMSQPFKRWGSNKKICRDDIIEDAQMFCYSRTKSDEENQNKSSKSASRYNLFQKALYLACKGNKRWVENL
jgi:hypothetical protein